MTPTVTSAALNYHENIGTIGLREILNQLFHRNVEGIITSSPGGAVVLVPMIDSLRFTVVLSTIKEWLGVPITKIMKSWWPEDSW